MDGSNFERVKELETENADLKKRLNEQVKQTEYALSIMC